MFRIIIVFLISTQIFAQTDLTLSGAIQHSLKNNYDIKIIEASEKIADENNAWGTAGRYPSVDFSLRSVNRFDDADNEIETYSITPSVTLNWTLFDGFKIFYNKYRLEDLYNKSLGNTAVVVENTIQAVILGYYRVLLEKEKLNVFKEVYELSKDRYERTKVSKELGNAVTYDVLQAKNAWLNDKATYLNQELIVNNSLRDLYFLMGDDEDVNYNLIDNFDVELKKLDMNNLKRKMLSDNSTLKNQYINEILQKREIQLAKASFLPRLSLQSGYDFSNTKTKINNSPTVTSDSYDYYANLTLSLNIFKGFNDKRALEIARIQKDISEIETEHMIHRLKNSLAQYFELYNVEKELLTVAEENLAAAKLNLQISEEKYMQGNINSFNYRDVQLIYLNSSLSKLRAVFNLISTETELMRITGGIITE